MEVYMVGYDDLTLTAAQAQGWADTLAARLQDVRHQINKEMAELDTVYLVRKGGTHQAPEVDSVAITEKNAQERRSELANENPLAEVEIENVELHT